MTEENNDLLWLNDAACADMSIDDFFVEAGHAISEEVLQVCQGCPVRVECVRHVYAMQVTGGYFGGMSPGQRRERTLDEAVRYVAQSQRSTSVEVRSAKSR